MPKKNQVCQPEEREAKYMIKFTYTTFMLFLHEHPEGPEDIFES